MASFIRSTRFLLPIALLSSLPQSVIAGDVLSTNGFQTCLPNSTMQVQNMDVQFDRATNQVTFNVAGTNTAEQNVTAILSISAYGKDIYSNSFDPCGNSPHVPQLCPVPKGQFSAAGNYTIPPEDAAKIPSIAYTIPDLDGMSKLELRPKDGPNKDQDIACIQAGITNTKTANVPGVQWAVAGIAGAALLVSGISALASAASGSSGGASSSPTFTEVMFWFQGVSQCGMHSVDYPGVYRDFTGNFAFSQGLVHWEGLERAIDSFRGSTGGNLTNSSVDELHNSTLIFRDSSSQPAKRDVSTNVNGQTTNVGDGAPASNDTNTPPPKNQKLVTGIQAYVEEVSVPSANTFMTALLVFAIVLAAVTASILLFKVILEAWALFGSFPKRLTSFRKNYWWLLAKTITNLILLLYGVWALYCIYQFRQGDSIAAKVLAGVTFAIFTAVLVGFTIRIFYMAHKYKKMDGDTKALYDNKDIWRKYSIFYDSFKRGYFWLFVPTIIFMLARGAILAAADGNSDSHGLAQTAALLIVDGVFLILVLVLRPFTRTSGNWINITIQVVRVLSVACILVFVEKLGFSQTTKTVTGVVLIVVQGALTAVLGILIAINAIINCVRMNPHRKQRKEMEKQRDGDALTPLDAHNSLLMYPLDDKKGLATAEVGSVQHARGRSQQGYDMLPLRDESSDRLLGAGAGFGHSRDRSASRDARLPDIGHERNRSHSFSSLHRQPQLPDLDFRGQPGQAL